MITLPNDSHGRSHDCHLTITWLSPDHHMTVTWPSHDCHMTITWLSLDHHMTVTWLTWSSHDSLDHMNVTWSSHDCHMIITWMSHDSLDHHMTHLIITWMSHDHHMTVTWPSHDCCMIITWPLPNHLTTWLRVPQTSLEVWTCTSFSSHWRKAPLQDKIWELPENDANLDMLQCTHTPMFALMSVCAVFFPAVPLPTLHTVQQSMKKLNYQDGLEEELTARRYFPAVGDWLWSKPPFYFRKFVVRWLFMLDQSYAQTEEEKCTLTGGSLIPKPIPLQERAWVWD